jgi:glutamate-1-semialdehyde 2,1-aminomutase
VRTDTSAELYRRALRHIPGGVNSPVRAMKSVGMEHPLFIARAAGSHLWDADGNEFIDLVGSWGPMILGWGHPGVLARLHEAVDGGTSYGAPTEREVRLAELICEAMPAVEMVRMTSSGTEATMSAVRVARAFTKRDKIVKFRGCYHGHGDSFLVHAGSGVLTLGLADSPGVPASTAADTLVLDYNDSEGLDELFGRLGEQIAGVIVEPVAANMGVVPPEPGFLERARELCGRYGALLIFDEVITGFRVGWSGAQGRYGVTPDITTLGKIIGGGLPVGAFGGRREIMELVAPAGPVYQAGTLSGNPLAMAAGLATLQALREPGTYEQLERLADRLEASLRHATAGRTVTINRVGGMFTAFFCEGPVRSFADAQRADTTRFARFWRHMLEHGVYLAPSQFEATMVSLALSEEDVLRIDEAVSAFFASQP